MKGLFIWFILGCTKFLLFSFVWSTSERMKRIERDRYFRDLYLNDLTFQCESLKVARACNITQMLSTLLDGYDNRIRPFEGDPNPLHVGVGIRIFDLYKIDAVNSVQYMGIFNGKGSKVATLRFRGFYLDYGLDLDLVQHWDDQRLASSSPEEIFIPHAMMKKVWIPDTFFLNSKHAYYHKITAPNNVMVLQPNGSVTFSSNFQQLYIYITFFLNSKHAYYHKITAPNNVMVLQPNGSVTFSSKITLRASCQMDFHLYPADTQVWIPDTFFLNSKHAYYHKITAPNNVMVLQPNGSVTFSSKITLRASCQMDFHLYPADTQTCYLQIQSFGYTADDIIYHWNQSRKWDESYGVTHEVPSFHILEFELTKQLVKYPLGMWSTIRASFTIQRHLNYFFIHLYCPCAIIVGLSWISFFIPKEGIGGRIRLAMIAMLNIITVLNLLSKVLPKVSYTKLIDIYLIVSLVFVFGVFIEYIIILWLSEQEKKRKERKEREANDPEKSKKDKAKKSPRNSKTKGMNFAEQAVSQLVTTVNPMFIDNEQEDENKEEEKQNMDNEDEDLSVKNIGTVGVCGLRFRVEMIDNTSKFIFPFSYITFNIIYWFYFFKNRNNPFENVHH